MKSQSVDTQVKGCHSDVVLIFSPPREMILILDRAKLFFTEIQRGKYDEPSCQYIYYQY